jgi:hypothetical protein
MAASAWADDLNRHKYNAVVGRKEGHERFGFDLKSLCFERESRPGFQVDKPETTLRVGQAAPRAPGQLAAHPTIHPPPQPGHGARVIHTVADDQQCPGLSGAIQKGRYVVGRVLAVAIQSAGPFKALIACQGQPGPDGSAFAEVHRMAHHRRARHPGRGGGGIRRTVIHHRYQGEMLTHGCDQRRDGGPLVETGDDSRASRRSDHTATLRRIGAEIEKKFSALRSS